MQKIHFPLLMAFLFALLAGACHTSSQIKKTEPQTTARVPTEKAETAPSTFSAWHNTPQSGSTQIKVVSQQTSSELEAQVISLLNRWNIEIDEKQPGSILTKPFEINSRTMRLLVDYEDGTALVSGEYSATSLNPSAHNWKTITPQHDLFWERLKVTAFALDHEKLLYN